MRHFFQRNQYRTAVRRSAVRGVGAVRIVREAFFQRAGVQFKQVVVRPVEIERASFALDPRTGREEVEAEGLDAPLAGLELVLGDAKGDVIVAACGQGVALHRRDPYAADVEEPFLGQGKLRGAAGVDAARLEHLFQHVLRPVQVGDDQRDVGQAQGHGGVPFRGRVAAGVAHGNPAGQRGRAELSQIGRALQPGQRILDPHGPAAEAGVRSRWRWPCPIRPPRSCRALEAQCVNAPVLFANRDDFEPEHVGVQRDVVGAGIAVHDRARGSALAGARPAALARIRRGGAGIGGVRCVGDVAPFREDPFRSLNGARRRTGLSRYRPNSSSRPGP